MLPIATIRKILAGEKFVPEQNMPESLRDFQIEVGALRQLRDDGLIRARFPSPSRSRGAYGMITHVVVFPPSDEQRARLLKMVSMP